MKSAAHLSLTPEELKSFEEFYERRLIEAGGSRSYEEDAEITAEMLRAVREDGMTPTADGGVSFVRRGGLDWTDPTAIDAAQVASGKKTAATTVKGGEGGVKDMLTGAAVLVALVVGLVWWFGFRGDAGKTDGTETPVAEETAAPGGDGSEMPTPIPTLESDLLANIVDGGVKTGLVAPRTLEIKNVSFVVQAVEIEGGDWPMPDDPRAVSWVYGTVVNYVMAIENTPENRLLLASLASGDELLLRMSTGPAYRFAYADIVRVAPQASEVFRQNRPGLTLALVGGEEDETQERETDRIIVRAVYIPDSELGNIRMGEAIGEPGQPVQVGDSLMVTALNSYPLPQASNIPDTVYLAVDYRVTNAGNSPLSTASFQHRVEAENVAYAVAAGIQGKTNPPLPVVIQAGQTITATGVYAIPEAVLRTGVIWFFSPALTSGLDARVALPAYAGPLEAEINIGMARMEGGGVMAMVDCYAPLEALTLGAENIQITGGTLDPVRSGLPWRIEAGERKQLALYFQAISNPVQVILSGRIFEISYQ